MSTILLLLLGSWSIEEVFIVSASSQIFPSVNNGSRTRHQNSNFEASGKKTISQEKKVLGETDITVKIVLGKRKCRIIEYVDGRQPSRSSSPTSGPTQDTPRVKPCAWEHCPKYSWIPSHLVLWPLSWEICSSAQPHPGVKNLFPDIYTKFILTHHNRWSYHWGKSGPFSEMTASDCFWL